MIEEGLMDGLDAALLFHPCDRDHVEASRSRPRTSSRVHGTAGARRVRSVEGRNALDAMIALFVSVGLWRQQLRPDARVHGIIQEGGTAANIIPERTRAWFMLRSADQAYYEVMKARFRQLCEAAALAAARVEVAFAGGATTMKQNRTLETRWVANAEAYGVEDEGPDPNSGRRTWGT